MRKLPRPSGYHWDSEEMIPTPAGGRSCRWCKRAAKRKWCGDPACVEQWTMRTRPPVFRAVVFRRDKGRCAWCNLDTRMMDLNTLNAMMYYSAKVDFEIIHGRDWHKLKTDVDTELACDPIGVPHPALYWFASFHAAITWRVKNKIKLVASPWQADHIKPVAEGGDWFGLDNIQTLCIPCHKIKTTAQNVARSAAVSESMRERLEGIGG